MEACRQGADVVMLDHFSPAEASSTARDMKQINPRLIVELSGGITKENIQKYLVEGVDIISVGAITQAFTIVDYSFKIDLNK